MDTTIIFKSVLTLFSSYIDHSDQPEDGRLDIYIPAEKIAYAVGVLVSTGKWHLSAITGLDVPQTQQKDGAIELLYHFCQKSIIVTLRIQVPYGMPTAPSICKVIPSAVLYEREVVELFGVILEGMPMRERLLLSDDWPDYVYPLRKSFNGIES
ncbi:MAG: NADH-quinone oxidoreductase subunit C [Anaerolineaceae bacterium]|nr:NADH-quinone oxidoreductase subunit C [Anaerolineaceae bacterium]